MFFSLGIGGHNNYIQRSHFDMYKTKYLVKQARLNIDNTVFRLFFEWHTLIVML